MSSAAAASCTTSHAARCAAGQWRRKSSSTAPPSPRCARARASVGALAQRPRPRAAFRRRRPARRAPQSTSQPYPRPTRDRPSARALPPPRTGRARSTPGRREIRSENGSRGGSFRPAGARRTRAARVPARARAAPARAGGSTTRTTTVPSRFAIRNRVQGGAPHASGAGARGPTSPAGPASSRTRRKPSAAPTRGRRRRWGRLDRQRVQQRLDLPPPCRAGPRPDHTTAWSARPCSVQATLVPRTKHSERSGSAEPEPRRPPRRLRARGLAASSRYSIRSTTAPSRGRLPPRRVGRAGAVRPVLAQQEGGGGQRMHRLAERRRPRADSVPARRQRPGEARRRGFAPGSSSLAIEASASVMRKRAVRRRTTALRRRALPGRSMAVARVRNCAG